MIRFWSFIFKVLTWWSEVRLCLSITTSERIVHAQICFLFYVDNIFWKGQLINFRSILVEFSIRLLKFYSHNSMLLQSNQHEGWINFFLEIHNKSFTNMNINWFPNCFLEVLDLTAASYVVGTFFFEQLMKKKYCSI